VIDLHLSKEETIFILMHLTFLHIYIFIHMKIIKGKITSVVIIIRMNKETVVF